MICESQAVTCATCPTPDKAACRKARDRMIAENHENPARTRIDRTPAQRSKDGCG